LVGVTGLAQPSIDSVNPSPAQPGDQVTVEGSNFAFAVGPLNSVILFDGSEINTGSADTDNDGNPDALTFQVPNGASCGGHELQVKNPTVGPFTSPAFSGKETLNVFCVSGLQPQQAAPGDQVTVQGGGFLASISLLNTPGSIVTFGGSDVATTFVSDTELTFQVPQNAAQGQHNVRVRNPFLVKPGGVTSNQATLTVPGGGGGSPLAINSVNPEPAQPGDQVTVEGSGFAFAVGPLNSVILVDGNEVSTGSADTDNDGNPDALTFQVPNGAGCGDHELQVKNPSPTPIVTPPEFSGKATLRVFCVSGLQPQQAAPGDQVTVQGGGFLVPNPVLNKSGSAVIFDGSAVATTVVSGTELTFQVPQNAAQGQYNVRVENPIPIGPGGVTSNQVTLTVSGGGASGQPPQADFSFAPGNPAPGVPVQFADQSTDPDQDIQSWTWDFDGDGNADSSDQNPSHAFASGGSFTVTLTVTDGTGQSDSASETIRVGGQSPALSVEAAVAQLVSNDPGGDNPDRVIGDEEIERAIQLWIAGNPVPDTDGKTIGDQKMQALIGLWVQGQPVSTASATAPLRPLRAGPLSLDDVRVAGRSSGVRTLEAVGTGIARVRAVVYDQAGRRVLTRESAGHTLSLPLRDDAGRPLANGVYLYRVAVRGAGGHAIRSDVRKLIVLK